MENLSRSSGFYWISINDQEPEVAFWDIFAGGWLCAGEADTVKDKNNKTVVLEGPLNAPPSRQFADFINVDSLEP